MPLLSELIDLPQHPLISIVGAGGKTTTMYTLAAELAGRGQRVVTTTTTHLFPPNADETDVLLIEPETERLIPLIASAWKDHRRITVASAATGSGKIAGLSIEQPFQLLTKSGADTVIVEADGARHALLKAPAEHEPPIPFGTTHALIVMNAGAINQPLSAAIAHRPERIANVAAMHPGEILTPARIARLMLSESGGLKNIPPESVIHLLITNVDASKRDAVDELGALVKRSSRIAQVLFSPEPGNWFSPFLLF
jgi:probable selenium-dependent hydroxylase accessory protein YqeC